MRPYCVVPAVPPPPFFGDQPKPEWCVEKAFELMEVPEQMAFSDVESPLKNGPPYVNAFPVNRLQFPDRAWRYPESKTSSLLLLVYMSHRPI